MAATIGSLLLDAEDELLQDLALESIEAGDAPPVHDHCPRCNNEGIWHTDVDITADGLARRRYTCMLCQHEWEQRWEVQ